MSLNWKEIDLVLRELSLPGAQIQKITQSTYSTLCLSLYGQGISRNLLIVINPGVCRLHETRRAVPKNEKPLRFAELLKSRILNTRIEEAAQLGSDRIVRLTLRRSASETFFLYIRLWSNAANVLLVDERGLIIDAMRRLPKRGEISGAAFAEPDERENTAAAAFSVRELPGEGTFNARLDAWYAEHGGALSLEALRAEAERLFNGRISRLLASLERLRAKEAAYLDAGRLKEYGDIILANLAAAPAGAAWLDAADFYHENAPLRLKLDPQKTAQENAAAYFESYRKAKHGLSGVKDDISSGEEELSRQKELLSALLTETNPLRLQKRLKTNREPGARPQDSARPGLSFRRGDWLIMVGRSAAENDELLRRHVKGNDLWLHARDFPGSYVFVKARPGKSVPLPLLLDAGNLALFYSKGRSSGKGDLFYTQVKYLRRVKNGKRGLVIPTQEKNLFITLDEKRLKEILNSKAAKKTSSPRDGRAALGAERFVVSGADARLRRGLD
jgi:predicted ribosome quality control (RQC) complex YloA/Tae2 family protein